MTDRTVDPVHAARVRILAHAWAERILAIPPDASERSRATRVGKIREKIRWFSGQMTRTVVFGQGVTVILHEHAAQERWWQAEWAAWDQVNAAIAADQPLDAFLLPS